MSTPDENTQINVNDDTVISANAEDDTIIAVPIEETVVGSVEVIDDSTVIRAPLAEDATVIGAPQPVSDDTVITADETVIPEATDEYNTLIGSLMDTSLGLSGLIEDVAVEPVRVEQEPQDSTSSRFRLRHINGTSQDLTKPVIYGRLPAAPLRGEQGVNLVVLASPEGIVSSSHARVEVQGDVVVVTDLRSTNGTRVIWPGKPTVLLGPGDSMALGAGAIIDLGDGNRIEVLG